MIQHSLVFDTDLNSDDVQRYANLPGVTGVSTYKNVLILYYEPPLDLKHRTAIRRAFREHTTNGSRVTTHIEQAINAETAHGA